MNRHNIVPFGTTPAGETVHKIHLQNQDLSCDILTYGATLQSLVVPDRDGQRVDSTMPGIHFYTANYVSVDYPGKGGCTNGPRHGFCLETQFYPDAIHHESFPSPILEAGKVYNHSTVFSFNNI